jgi:hypothetical protein
MTRSGRWPQATTRVPRWLPTLSIGSLLLALAGLPAPAAHASHPHPSSETHLNFQHYASAGTTATGRDEQYCVESHNDSALSDADARAMVADTLNNQPADQRWDGLGDWRIDLWPTAQRCDAYDDSTLATIEVRVRFNTSWPNTCGFLSSGVAASCVRHYGLTENVDFGHWDSRRATVYMVIGHHTGVLNHEFGHVFGLVDPDSSSSCEPPSLMHSNSVGYFCDNWPYRWPSPADRQTVTDIIYGRIY